MITTRRLSERIDARIEQHRRELSDSQQQLDERMKELLDQRERGAIIGKSKIETVVLPRLEELKRHFPNMRIDVQNAEGINSCICEFSHTLLYPATAKLVVSLVPKDSETFVARYNLEILPSLMEFDRNAEAVFTWASDAEDLSIWLEDRILEFVETYLRLETHPLYQKENNVVDIVCGMQIPSTAAACSIEWHGRTFYFCSEHCKETFIKNNN